MCDRELSTSGIDDRPNVVMGKFFRNPERLVEDDHCPILSDATDEVDLSPAQGQLLGSLQIPGQSAKAAWDHRRSSPQLAFIGSVPRQLDGELIQFGLKLAF
jgi:hypothetical protein